MSESKVPSIPPPEVAEAFRSAAITALQELTQLEAFPEEHSDAAAAAPSGLVVAAAVRLNRKSPGLMTLVLTREMASSLAARYLPAGTQLTEEIIDDVAGEFANVVAGQAKTILKGTSYHFTMSTPNVTRMLSFSILPVVAGSTLAISLVTESGRVLVFVALPPCPGA